MIQLKNEAKGRIKVLIADDHKLVRESWKTILENNPMFNICALAGDGSEAIAYALNNEVDIVLMDINMQPVNGLEAVAHLHRVKPGIKIIAVSMNVAIANIKKIMQFGASGYINKNSSVDELTTAITEVSGGKKYFCNETRNLFAEKFLCDDHTGPELLTERQLSIIQFIKLGLSSEMIGKELGISGKTVEVHRYNILKKFKLNNTASLINTVNELGI